MSAIYLTSYSDMVSLIEELREREPHKKLRHHISEAVRMYPVHYDHVRFAVWRLLRKRFPDIEL